jgi:hypothetical protein
MHEIDPADGRIIHQIDWYDDERSVFNLAPERLKKAMDQANVDVFAMTLSELHKKAKPDVDWKRLRVAFWIEYERAVRAETLIDLKTVCKGIMTKASFLKTLEQDQYKLAWILTPIEEHKVMLEEMFLLAVEEERKILDQPLVRKCCHVNKKGDLVEWEEFDHKLAALKHKIREDLHTRIYGAPVQRAFNVNVNQDGGSADPASLPPKDLAKLVQDLEAENETLQVGGVTEDVGSTGVKED